MSNEAVFSIANSEAQASRIVEDADCEFFRQ
jgi:hypothetical protein